MIEAMGEAAAVDVEGGEDFENGLHGDVAVDRPADDFQVFLAQLQAVENAIEQQGLVLEALGEQAVIAALELDPEGLALQVLRGGDTATAHFANPPTG